MLGGLKRYIQLVASSWGKSVSGPFFAVLTFGLLIWQLIVKDPATAPNVVVWGYWLTLGAAIFFILIAQFKVWRAEHKALVEAEDKLNAAADMRGPIWIQLSAVNPNADQTKPASALGYTFDCSNHGKVPCELNKVIVKLVPPDGRGFNLIQDLHIPQVIEPGRAFKYQATCAVQGVSVEDLRKTKITVYAVDSLGTEYQHTETKVTNMVLKMPAPHTTPKIRLSMRDPEF